MCRNAKKIIFLSIVVSVAWTERVMAWDPWGDIQRPGRILENAKREGTAAVQTVGEAVQKAAPVIATLSCPGCAILVNALPADQKNLVETIVTKGMVVTTLGPVAGLYYLTVLDAKNGDLHKDDVPIQIIDVPRTPKNYTADLGTSACITQITSTGVVQIYAKTPPSFWTVVQAGDIITAKAAPCPEYNALSGIKNITSIVFKLNGASTNQLVADGAGYRYLINGTPAS